MIAWQKAEEELRGKAWKMHPARRDKSEMVGAVRDCIRPLLMSERLRDYTYFRTLLIQWIREAMLVRLKHDQRAKFRDIVWGETIGEALRSQNVGMRNQGFRAVIDGLAVAVAEAVLDDVLGVK